MKNTILSVAVISLMAVSQAHAMVPTVEVPEASTTGLLLGIAVLGGLAVKRFFKRR